MFSEAHGCCDHWVDYWLHTGHLYIEGRKMSKSLKNFISIDDYLTGRWTGRASGHTPLQTQMAAADLRIFFLQHKYHSALHFTVERIQEASGVRKKLENVLALGKQVMRDISTEDALTTDRQARMNELSLELSQRLAECKREVRLALADDFDTPTALHLLVGLAGHLNRFLLQCVLTDKSQCVDPLYAVMEYVESIIDAFGLRVVWDSQVGVIRWQSDVKCHCFCCSDGDWNCGVWLLYIYM